MHMFFLNYWLDVLMHDVLMVLMHNISVFLLHDVLVMFVDNVLMKFSHQGSFHVFSHDGLISVGQNLLSTLNSLEFVSLVMTNNSGALVDHLRSGLNESLLHELLGSGLLNDSSLSELLSDNRLLLLGSSICNIFDDLSLGELLT